MTTSVSLPQSDAFSPFVSRRRILAHAAILACCLWGVCLVDFATPELFDRAGNVKFQDFLQFPIAARLIMQGRANDLFNRQVLADEIRATLHRQTSLDLQYFYGPQVALPFTALLRLPFLAQAATWVTLSLLLYFACIYSLWKKTSGLASSGGVVAVCALGYPPLFHFFVRGQISALALLIFTLAYLALREKRDLLGGIALGFLFFKPQFLVAVPLIFLFAQSWRAFAGVVASAATQLGFTTIYFGPVVVRNYFSMILHSAGHPGSTELSLSPIQMHSLRSFWTLLIPSSTGVWVLYLLSSCFVLAITTVIWKSSLPLGIRFSGLVLSAVLVNPHIYIYDLLALAPALLLLAEWGLKNGENPFTPRLGVLLYLAFLLPLFGPLARWTHLQLSVLAFAALLWTLYRFATHTQKLASAE